MIEWWPLGPFEFDTEVRELVPAGRGRILGIWPGAARFEIREVRQSGPSPVVFSSTTWRGFALAVSSAGTTYVAASNNGLHAVLEIDATGNLRATWPLPAFTSGPIDLAADQCTLFTADGNGGTIRRFNVCTGVPGTDFGTVGTSIHDLHILPDGGVIVAAGGDVITYDVDGTFRRSYTPPEGRAKALGLESSGRVMVAVSDDFDAHSYRLDLESGSFTLRTPDDPDASSINLPDSIVAFSGWTAALGPTAPAGPPNVESIPTASGAGLLVLGALLALLAFRRLM